MREEQLAIDIRDLNVLHNVAVAYAQISSVRMKRERESVLSNREFQAAIDEIFKDVLSSYARQAQKLIKRRGQGAEAAPTFLSHNGKTVAVLISANTGLYGDIVARTFNYFLEDIADNDVEIAIVGRLGQGLFLGVYPDRPYTFFELPDYGASQDDLAAVIRHIVQYETIHIYFGKFENVAYQTPGKAEIAAKTPLSELGERTTNYLFEPTLEEILQFFETEIFASLFEQVVRESQLAKFASRMMAMDRASFNIKKRLAAIGLQNLRASHHKENRRQLNSLSSLMYAGS